MPTPKDSFPTAREKIQNCRDICFQLETDTEKRIKEAEDLRTKQNREGRLSDLRNLRVVFESLLSEEDEVLLEEEIVAEFIRSRRELIRYQADPDRLGPSAKVLKSLREKGEA